MSIPYDYHLNFEALKKSATELENFLNQHRKNDEDVNAMYQSLKNLFYLIKTDQLKKAIDGNLEAGYIMGERDVDGKYPGLRTLYSIFSSDISGCTDDPNRVKRHRMIEEIRAKVLAEKAAQEGK